jgi:hypothetical protein
MLEYGEGPQIEIFCFQICHNVRKREIIKAYSISVGNPKGKRPLVSYRRRGGRCGLDSSGAG